MIRLTKLADYSVILMCEMTHADTRLSAQDLSTKTNIPVPTVSKILNMLGRANLLVSTRGLKGGFALSQSADEITVGSIIEAIDGPIALTLCSDKSLTCDCGFDDVCSLRPRWQLINNAVKGALDSVSLASIAEPAFAGVMKAIQAETAQVDPQ